jgi:hypothetical protein
VQAPDWMIEQMLKEKNPHRPAQTKSCGHPVTSAWSDRDWALSYLAAIPPTEDYETWIQVGMCLHTADENLLHEWDCWSQGATNYESGECDKKWRTFKPNKGLRLGTLGQLAKQNGWQSSLKGSNSLLQTSIKNGTNTKAALSSSEETAETFEELAQEVHSFVSLTEETAPIGSLLSTALTYPLMQRAKQFHVPVEAFIAILLPIAASLLKIGTRLDIAESTDYSCPPILCFVLLDESGANKSPILDTLLRSLEKLQAQADESHQLNIAQYDEEVENWQTCPKEKQGNKPIVPVQREYYLQDATWEAIALCLSTQSNRGIVIPLDEFASLFNELNQYRPGGKGNDRQKYLSAYRGGAIKSIAGQVNEFP